MTSIRTGGRLAVLLTAIVALASCGGDGEIDNQLSFRLIQTSADAPSVNFLVDDVGLFNSRRFSFAEGTNFFVVTPRSYSIGFKAATPGRVEDLDEDILPTVLAAGMEYTFVLIGEDATDSLQTLVFDQPVESIPAGQARLQFMHAAPPGDLPVPGTLDFYVTAVPESDPLPDLSTETPFTPASYGFKPAARLLQSTGLHVIRVTPAGLKTPVLFTSNPVPLSSRIDWLLIAVTNTGTGSAPIALVVNDRTFTDTLFDESTPADLRIVHVSPDAPALDFIDDRGTVVAPPDPPESDDVTLVSGLTYLGTSGYFPGLSGVSTIRVATTAAPATGLDPFSFLWTNPVGRRTTVLAANLLASINDITLPDEGIRAITSEGRVRFVHAASLSANVDVYVLKSDPGTDIADVGPNLASRLFGSVSDYGGFEPDNYTVTFTRTGSKDVLATAEVDASPGTVQTVILVGEVPAEGSPPAENPPAVLLLNDLDDPPST